MLGDVTLRHLVAAIAILVVAWLVCSYVFTLPT